MHVRTSIRRQNGAAMVEMALVLPILALLVFGLVDFARALNYWNDTNQLAGEAARHAAVNRNPGADLDPPQSFEQYIRCGAETQEIRGPGVECPGEPTAPGSDSVQSTLQICYSAPNGTDVGDPLTIRVRNRFWVIPLVREAISDVSGDANFASLNLVGEATMRLEQRFTQELPECPASA